MYVTAYALFVGVYHGLLTSKNYFDAKRRLKGTGYNPKYPYQKE